MINIEAWWRKTPLAFTAYLNKYAVNATIISNPNKRMPIITLDLTYSVGYVQVQITKMKRTTTPTYIINLLIIFGKNCTSKKYINANTALIKLQVINESWELKKMFLVESFDF